MIAGKARNPQNCRKGRDNVRKLQNNLYLTAKKGKRRFHALCLSTYAQTMQIEKQIRFLCDSYIPNFKEEDEE